MTETPVTRPTGLRPVATYGILFLFFFQLIADFIETVYVFGLLGTEIPIELVFVLLLLSPFLLALFPKGLAPVALIAVGELVFLCRAVEVMLGTRGRMMVAGLGSGAFLLFLPALLLHHGRLRSRNTAVQMGAGLALAVGASVLLRSAGSGLDVSTFGAGQIIGVVLAVAGGLLLVRLIPERPKESAEPTGDRPGSGVGRATGLSLGMTAALALLYFAFTSPTVISRWSDGNYLLVLALVGVALSLFGWLITTRPETLYRLSGRAMLLLNALFALALAATLRLQQISFPADPGGYPLAAPPVADWHALPLVITLLLFPIILLDFIMLVRELTAERRSGRIYGLAFGLAAAFLLLLIFAQVFTAVYDYIPLVGPFFRDRYWQVFLLAAAVLTASQLIPSKRRQLTEFRLPKQFPVAFVVFGVGAVAAAAVVMARPSIPRVDTTGTKVLTWNIQQGFSRDGLRNFDGQLEVLRELNADVIGLQETDNARIAGGNADVVRYLADRLDMHAFYGPSSVVGTFGVALLSRYPIHMEQVHYLYSEGEQVAVVEARVHPLSGMPFFVVVTHLGNDCPPVQVEQFLQLMAGRVRTIAMGDFNCRPDEAPYHQITGLLTDAWLATRPAAVDDRCDRLSSCVDHTFMTRGVEVVNARYVDGSASDHPAMLVDIVP